MSPARPKQDVLVYLQRDIEALKHTLDRILRPYKADVKSLRDENASLRGNINKQAKDIEHLMVLISKRSPELIEEALATIVNKDKKGWQVFRTSWLRRLEIAQ